MFRDAFFLLALLALFTSVLSTPAPSNLQVRSIPSVPELLFARGNGGHNRKASSNETSVMAINSTSSGKRNKGNKAEGATLAAINSTTNGHKSKNGTVKALQEDRPSKKEKSEQSETAKSTASSTGSSNGSTTTSTSFGIRVEAWSSAVFGLLVVFGFCVL